MMVAMMITTLLLTKTEIPSNVNMMHEVRLLTMQFAKNDDVGIMMVQSEICLSICDDERLKSPSQSPTPIIIIILIATIKHHYHRHHHRLGFAFMLAPMLSVWFSIGNLPPCSVPGNPESSRKCAWAEGICSRHASSIARVVRM